MNGGWPPNESLADDTSMYNGTNNFHAGLPHQQYQVHSTVPAKRQRDDGLDLQQQLHSRSQTPQQFQGNQPLQPQYAHLQHGGSANATPSPTMSNQQFRPPPQQNRLQTVSPNPPFAQQQGMGMSPPPDANGRVNTPQSAHFNMGAQMGQQMGGQMGGMNYMPGTSMPQGYNQSFGAAPNMAGAAQNPYGTAPQVQLTPNLQAEMQRMQQLKMQQQQSMMAQNRAAQQQAQQMAAMNQGMAMNQRTMDTPTRPQGQPGMNPQQQQQQQQQQNRLAEEQAFLQRVGRYMVQSGRQFDAQPMVAGRPISLFYLFNIVLKAKGSKRVTAMNQWPQVAAAMRYPPDQFPTAAMEIKEVFERCLGLWEAATWHSMSQQQKIKMDAMQQTQVGAAGAAPQMSPNRLMPQTPQNPHNPQMQNQQYMAQLQQRMNAVQQQQQIGQMTPVQNNASLPPSNGWSTPQSGPASGTPQVALDSQRKSVSRPLESSPAQVKQPTFATPPPSKLPGRTESSSKITNGNVITSGPWTTTTNYKPNVRQLETSWGGIEPDNHGELGEEIARLRPDVPDVAEMGNLDLHAITCSLQSGIHGEVRYALDYLVKISNEPRIYVELEACEDLVDILIDCAEEQVETLADDAPEVTDILDLSSYEDVVKNVKIEIHGLQDVPEAGTLAYRLERAADRLIAITTILRNFSFPQPRDTNQPVLASPLVIKFIANAIRLVGTRTMFLRTHSNTQDFMKDIVVFLSNIADRISLPSREDALSILHFLLSFAPGRNPTTLKSLRFSYYNPTVHPYYPPAIDSLAKLLARDEPNRSYYKELFSEHIGSPLTPVHQQYDLLTRAFSFAVATVPERVSSRAPANQQETLRLTEARKPTLSQGMLAADILSTLCPGVEVGLAKAWLHAEDGWAPSLFRLAVLLMKRDSEINNREAQAQRHAGAAMPRRDPTHIDNKFDLIIPRALAMIKCLARKSLDTGLSPSSSKPSDSDPEEAGAPGETGAGGEVKSIDAAKADGLCDADEEWERAMTLSGLNGEIIPMSETLHGYLYLIGMDLQAWKELWELAQLALG